MRLRVSLFWSMVIVLVVTYLLLRFGVGYLSQFITDSENPLPVPSTLLSIYVVLILVGLGVYVAMSDENLQDFFAPVVDFLRGPESVTTRGERVAAGARWATLGVIPLLVGFMVYTQVLPGSGTPVTARIQHPGLPKQFEDLENPFRDADEATVAQYMQEGRDLFYINCRPCHGTKANGDGPMARGFRLRPANFTDPGTIATVIEAFAFWRVNKGNPGLPPASTPWDSAMPTWERDLTTEEIWKIIMAEYDIAGVEPRKPE
jgi:mono/diheme cytochrome c family protein